jgi:hypothetical protein
MLAAFSWLALSNHCALGLAMVANHGTEEVSTHDCCASTTPSQPEPIRKVFRAMLQDTADRFRRSHRSASMEADRFARRLDRPS